MYVCPIFDSFHRYQQTNDTMPGCFVCLQRDNIVKGLRSGQIWVLICTELMGRGIDFKGVNLVINYDFPNSAISYIHRIGKNLSVVNTFTLASHRPQIGSRHTQ